MFEWPVEEGEADPVMRAVEGLHGEEDLEAGAEGGTGLELDDVRPGSCGGRGHGGAKEKLEIFKRGFCDLRLI